MAHTLRIRKANAAKGVTAQLRKGTANPEDNVSKLLLALLRLQDATNAIMPSPPSDNADAAADNNLLQQEAALGSVLQEWLGSMMQRFYRKQTPENNSRYLQELMTYVPPDMVFRTLSPGGLEGQEAPLNPLRQLHPLETQDVISLMQTKADVNNSAAASELPACINSDWQAGVVSLLLGERPGVGPHPVLNRFVLAAGRLLALLLPPASAAGPAAGKAIKDTVAVPSDAADGSSKAARSILEQLPGPSAALETCWPSWKQSALEALLLRFRTGRYRSSMPAQSDAPQAIGSDMMVVNGVVRPAATSTKCEWVAVPVQSCLVLALQRLQDALSGELQGLKQKRLNEVKEQLLISTALLMKQHAGDADEACRSLKQLKLQLDVPSADQPSSKAPGPQAEHKHGAVATLLGHTCTLKRTDVPLVLQQIGALPGLPTAAGEQEVVLKVGEVTPQMLHALVLGDWSRQRPQVCRRSLLVKQLCQHFGSDCSDVEAAMQAEEVCCRPKVCNRHGHTAELPYPGPAGWTEAYAAARMAAVKSRRPGMVKKVQKKLQAMEKFTQMATEAKAAAAGDAAKLAAVCEVLASTHDPRFIDRIMSQVNQILQRA